MSSATAGDHLTRLTSRVVRGMDRLPHTFLAKQRDYVLNTQLTDGGFPDRGGTPDLYYTSFALRCAELLDIVAPGVWMGAAGYVQTHAPATVVDCLGMLYGAYVINSRPSLESRFELDTASKDAVESVLARCAAPAGGAANAPGGQASVYHTFLAAACCQLLGRCTCHSPDAVQFVLSCRRDDGGFADRPDAAVTSGANPTAAAVAFLSMHGALDARLAKGTADFIVRMQLAEGGFAAHANAPVADLMSTFTSLVTLAELDALRRVALAPVARYARQLAAAQGGWRATAVDAAVDLEYTYYGLGVLGILGSEVASHAAAPDLAARDK